MEPTKIWVSIFFGVFLFLGIVFICYVRKYALKDSTRVKPVTATGEEYVSPVVPIAENPTTKSTESEDSSTYL